MNIATAQDLAGVVDAKKDGGEPAFASGLGSNRRLSVGADITQWVRTPLDNVEVETGGFEQFFDACVL